jgi:universal stress protein A
MSARRNKSGASTPKRESAQSRRPLKWRRILVPLDFSGHSRRALEAAVPLARRSGGRIIVVHVVQPPVALSPIPASGQYVVPIDNERAIQAAQDRLNEQARKLVPPGLLESALVRQGNPAHEITSVARKLKVDLIAIATRGHSGLKRVLIGSTAERVVRHAGCPVLAVRRD